MAVAASDAPTAPARSADGPAARPRLRDLDRRVQLALAAILLVAFAVRAWAALNPLEDPGPDAEAYANLARWLYEDQSYGAPDQESASDWSPGAPLLYSAVYYLTFGENQAIARLVIALLGTAMTLGVFLLALRLSGRAAAGLVGAAAIATYPTFVENNAQYLSEPLAAFLLTAGLLAFLWAAERRRLRAWLVPGLLFGALILTRPEYQAITAVFVLFAAWRAWRDHGRAWRPALVSGLVVALGAVVVVVPWTIHNVIVLDRLVPVSTGSQKALFVATYLPGLGRQVPTKRELMRRLEGFKDPISTGQLKAQPMQELLDKVARNAYPEMERDAALGRLGRENFRRYVTEQPLAYARMTALKLWTMWNRGSSPYMQPWGWTVYHRVLLLLGFAGFVLLVRSARTRFAALLLAAPIAAITVIGTLLLAVPRRHVPLLPLVAVFAGIAAVWLVVRVRERRAGAPATA